MIQSLFARRINPARKFDDEAVKHAVFGLCTSLQLISAQSHDLDHGRPVSGPAGNGTTRLPPRCSERLRKQRDTAGALFPRPMAYIVRSQLLPLVHAYAWLLYLFEEAASP